MCVDTQKLVTRLKASIVSVFPSGSVRMNEATAVLGLLQDSFLGRCIVQVLFCHIVCAVAFDPAASGLDFLTGKHTVRLLGGES